MPVQVPAGESEKLGLQTRGMTRFAQLVMGPAGCGKSTYCATVQEHFTAAYRKSAIGQGMSLSSGPNLTLRRH